jgi:hypothetical protein
MARNGARPHFVQENGLKHVKLLEVLKSIDACVSMRTVARQHLLSIWLHVNVRFIAPCRFTRVVDSFSAPKSPLPSRFLVTPPYPLILEHLSAVAEAGTG